MRARYYSPYLTRFLNADPSGFSGGPNWFVYADGNPISRFDPFGLCGVPSNYVSPYDSDGSVNWTGVGNYLYEAIAGVPDYIQQNGVASANRNLSDPVFIATNALGGMGMGGITGGLRGAENNTTRIGRWMSEAEHAAMVESRTVQAPLNGAAATHVTVPPNPTAFTPPPQSTIFSEFNVPTSQLNIHDAAYGWGRVFGPGSLEARLAASKGLPGPTSMPPATNIRITNP